MKENENPVNFHAVYAFLRIDPGEKELSAGSSLCLCG
jgi:hypothetical protein